MRLIDADAVIEELRQIYNDCDDWETHISQSDLAESEKRILTNRASATKMVMIEVRLRVDKIPSADVVERKKGKWEDKEVFNETDDDHIVDEWQSARCSACGLYHTTPYSYNFTHYKFCPNCGCAMEGAKNQ